MADLTGLQIFKYLPAAKKLPEGNCKKCGCPTCMAYALKLAKGQEQIEHCPHFPEDLRSILEQSLKKPQEEILLGEGKNKVLVGGENVLFRHDKTFVNKTAICVLLNPNEPDFAQKLKRITEFEVKRINDIFKVDLICFEDKVDEKVLKELDELGFAWCYKENLSQLPEVKDENLLETASLLTKIRKKAVLEKDEAYSMPVVVHVKETDLNRLIAKASFYLCKYANVLVFDTFDEALFVTLMTLRQDIYTDPQKPLQVESKVYEFNNPDENALVFVTTNFALTYFAVANELEALNRSSYLVITPSDGMSVLTAWSAEKFTSELVAKTVRKFNMAEKVKHKKLIIPGLLADIRDEIQQELPEFEIVVGTNEAYKTADFVKTLDW